MNTPEFNAVATADGSAYDLRKMAVHADTARIDAFERQLTKMDGMALTMRPGDRFRTLRDLMDYFIAHPDDATPSASVPTQPFWQIVQPDEVPTADLATVSNAQKQLMRIARVVDGLSWEDRHYIGQAIGMLDRMKP